MRSIAMAFTALASGAALTLGAAHAQTADHPSCAPWKVKWGEVGAAADIKAMDGLIGQLPSLCPALKAEAATRRASVAKDAALRQAANEEARRANDPCQQARNDWSHVQTGSEATLQAYIGALPAACGVWKSQAQERLEVVVSERLAKEQDKKRADELIAAAKATKIEARWAWEATGSLCGNPQATGSQTLEIIDGSVVRTYWDFRSKREARYAITRVEGNTVFALETSPGPAGKGENSFAVSGNKLAFFQPEREKPGWFTEPASTQGYTRCP